MPRTAAHLIGLNKQHGLLARGKRTPEMRAWDAARRRCHNPFAQCYTDYGGRGITMCDRWRFGEDGLYGLECFLADMGPKPSPAHTLERMDNNKGYSPENCLWATHKEQGRNMRTTNMITFFGERVSVGDLADSVGFNRDTVRTRLKRYGWKIGRALSETPRVKPRRSP
jgi:hypothetical protein